MWKKNPHIVVCVMQVVSGYQFVVPFTLSKNIQNLLCWIFWSWTEAISSHGERVMLTAKKWKYIKEKKGEARNRAVAQCQNHTVLYKKTKFIQQFVLK